MTDLELTQKVQENLDSIRTYLQADGGDAQLVSCKDGIVTINVFGHCITCGNFDATFTLGIKQSLFETYPHDVLDVIFLNANGNEIYAGDANINHVGYQEYALKRQKQREELIKQLEAKAKKEDILKEIDKEVEFERNFQEEIKKNA